MQVQVFGQDEESAYLSSSKVEEAAAAVAVAGADSTNVPAKSKK